MATPGKGNWVQPEWQKMAGPGTAPHSSLVGTHNFGLSPEEKKAAEVRAQLRSEKMFGDIYLEKIGDRIKHSEPRTMPDFELVETAFFLKIHGLKTMPGTSWKYWDAMTTRLSKDPSIAAKLLRRLQAGNELPVGFRFIDNIHSPMYAFLERMAGGVKAGGRKTRKTRKNKARRHRKKTRGRK